MPITGRPTADRRGSRPPHRASRPVLAAIAIAAFTVGLAAARTEVAAGSSIAPAVPQDARGDQDRLRELREAAEAERRQLFRQAQDRIIREPGRQSRTAGIPEELIRDLASADYGTREAASAAILMRGGLRPRDVERLARAGTLPLEAINRLLEVCRVTHVEAPRGALGIMHRPPGAGWRLEPGTPTGTEISDLVPGFDAARRLQPFDLIVRIGQESIVSRSGRDLGAAVQRRRPGDLVDIEIRRPRRGPDGAILRRDGFIVADAMTITVQLGDYEDLSNDDIGGRRRASTVEDDRRAELRAVNRMVLPEPRQIALPDVPGVRAGTTRSRSYRGGG